MRLRTQLALVSLALLGLPWAGCQYAREMGGLLRQGQASAVLATAKAVSAAVSARADLIDPQPIRELASDIYAHALNQPLQIDGYSDDWGNLLRWRKPLANQAGHYLVATDNQSLYLLIEASNAPAAYREPYEGSLYNQVLLSVRGPDQIRADYRIAPTSPGLVIAERLSLFNSNSSEFPEFVENWPEIPETLQESDYPLLQEIAKEVRIQGVWQQLPDGYTLELSLPLEWAKPKFGLRVISASNQKPESPTLGRLVYVRNELSRLVAGFSGGGYRIWILDPQGRVLAQGGQLDTSDPDSKGSLTDFLKRRLLTESKAIKAARSVHTPRLTGSEIDAALAGEASGSWQLTKQDNMLALSAALPIEGVFGRLGAVVVEQADRPTAALSDFAFTRLLGVSFLVLLGTALILFFFASLLSLRIQKLHRAAEAALTKDGNISGDFPTSPARDELGDLSRSFGRLLSGIREYTEYLRSLGSKLSHELRTPLAVVRSSLENLEQENLSPAARVYAERAQQGTKRLSVILSALSEASRIESAIRDAETERFQVKQVIDGCIAGYMDLYKDRRIDYRTEAACDREMLGAPELIAQLLDKLMDNAVDFSPPRGWIRVIVSCTEQTVIIDVENQGPGLPENMRERLFDSMVSLRDTGGDKLHLGLGLYISRLIAEYHQGSLVAENLPNSEGVRFRVTLRSRDSL